MFWALFLLAFFLSLFFVFVVRRLGIKFGKLVTPRPDRWHSRPTPTLGGIGIFLAFILSLGITVLFFDLLNGNSTYSITKWLLDLRNNLGILAGSSLVFCVGLIDDFKPLSPRVKLAGQLLASVLVVSLGFTTNFFTPRLANPDVAQLLNILLTVIWLVGITNAINLLDNMDGLAGGIAFITAVLLGILFYLGSFPVFVSIALALAGSILGFLFFNFPPAKIFMGDSGSLFLGFSLAALSIARQPQASNVFAVLAVPTLLFLLPIMDTLLVTLTRMVRGESPIRGGRDHTSHRLIAFGLNERQTLLVLYFVAGISGIFAIGIESYGYSLSLILVPLFVLIMALITTYLGGMKITDEASDYSKELKDGGEIQRKLARVMVGAFTRIRLLEVILDFFLIGFAYYLATVTRYGLSLDQRTLFLFSRSLPVILVNSYIALILTGVYQGVWRYVSVDEVLHYLEAAVGSAILSGLSIYFLDQFRVEWAITAAKSSEIAPILIFFGLYLFLGLVFTRSSFKFLDRYFRNIGRDKEQRVIIYGAGDFGEIALRWIRMNPRLNYRPVGFLDNDPLNFKRVIHGVKVFGDYNLITPLIDKKQLDGLIIALDVNRDKAENTAEKDREFIEKVIVECAEHGIWIKNFLIDFQEIDKT